MSTPETAVPGERPGGLLSPLLTAATLVVLVPLGAVVGMFCTFGAGWLTRYWGAGMPVPVLAAAGLLAFLGLLYGVCRLCAWGSRRPSASVAFAVGYLAATIALISYLSGGNVVLTDHLMHNAYLFGTMLVLMLAVIRGWAASLAVPRQPASPVFEG